MTRSLISRAGATLIALSFTSSSLAEDSEIQSAATHFQTGLERVKSGDIDAAAKEFEQAFRASPNYSVLYNLGNAYSVMGHAVDAVKILAAYLAAGGTAIDVRRRREVEHIIALNEKRIGRLELVALPADARIQIDGKPTSASEFPLRLVAGEHYVSISAATFGERTQVFSVESGLTTSVDAHLMAAPGPALSFPLRVSCRLADVQVSLDGTSQGQTPMREALTVSPGVHRVAFVRSGYETAVRYWQANTPGTIDCALQPRSNLGADECSIELELSEPNAEVRIDGIRWAGRREIPLGKHYVDVSKAGYQPWSSEVDLARGEHRKLIVKLIPQPDFAADRLHSIRVQHLAAYTVVGAGAVSLLTAGGLALMSSHVYHDWQKSRDGLASAMPSADPKYLSLQQEVEHNAVQVRTFDDWGLSSAIAGSSLLVTGFVVLLLADDPKPYDMPSVRITPNGLNLELSHTF
jgi:hypothetical protein